MTPKNATPAHIELPAAGETGTPFIDVLYRRCGGKVPQTRRIAAFIQEWDHLRDEVLAKDPTRTEVTVEEYAERWTTPIATAFRMQAEFRQVFPGESTPTRLVKLLWDGMPVWSGVGTPPRLKQLISIEVVER